MSTPQTPEQLEAQSSRIMTDLVRDQLATLKTIQQTHAFIESRLEMIEIAAEAIRGKVEVSLSEYLGHRNQKRDTIALARAIEGDVAEIRRLLREVK